MSNTRRPTNTPPRQTIHAEHPAGIGTATLNRVLDDTKFGDLITITRTNLHNGTAIHSTTIAGPALVGLDPETKHGDTHRVVGIDLLDGQPHLIRDGKGVTSGKIVSITIRPSSGHHDGPTETETP